jgi:MerR family transcriptional regulator/heat shock protein HspR
MIIDDITPAFGLQRFEPETNTLYSLEMAAHLGQVGRHLVLLAIREALIDPLVDPEYGGYYFDREDIRLLRRIGYLHTDCGINLAGVRMILMLSGEVDRLRNELEAADRSWR